MAILKDSNVEGNLKVSGTIFGNIEGDLEGVSTYATNIGNCGKCYNYEDIKKMSEDSKNASCITSGVLGYKYGGTGLSSIGASGQILSVRADGKGMEWKTVDIGESKHAKNADRLNGKLESELCVCSAICAEYISLAGLKECYP